ncbi:MAG: Npt1/Npt2 family nucleotide transporter [Gemmatimonas sp.]
MIRRLISRVVIVEEGEWRATLLAFAFFFFLLASYLILRSIRDAVGVAAGTANLPWLFSGTLIATLLVNPAFAAVVSRLPVRQFIPIVYRMFGALLVVFAATVYFTGPAEERFVGPAFWIFISVFSLFVPSVFWGFMADTFFSEQGKRLYGFIGVGGTLGGMFGSTITSLLATRVGTPVLMLMSVVLLECAVQVARRFPPSFRAETRDREVAKRSLGGSSLAGVTHVFKSPYLLGICLYMLLFTIGTTVLYFQQAEIVGARYADRESRTAFLASIDFYVQLITILTQLFISGRVIKWIGVGMTLSILPIISIIGFSALGMYTSLSLFVAFTVLRRAGNYAFANPGREVLFSVILPEDKYKAKNFVDTFAYRSGDQIGAWSYRLLSGAGLAVSSIALLAVPMSAAWLFVSLWLGRRHTKMQAETEDSRAVAVV